MMRFYYDVHLHSCLSPCGDDDMTPNNIAGMGTVNGLQILALTDHNTCGNCSAFMSACKKQGIVPIPGMELTTSEDIHMVCLFPDLQSALSFDEVVQSRRVKIENRPDIFGNQLLLDQDDNQIGTDSYLLPNATTISLEEGFSLCEQFGGVAYPAHIDREANGIIAILGLVPDVPKFSCVELHDADKKEEYAEQYHLHDKRFVFSSDAHYLWDISEKQNYVDLDIDDNNYSSALVREKFLALLKGGAGSA